MRTRRAIERYRREAVRAQHAAASAHAWVTGRIDRGANRSDVLCDQAYVANLYRRARAATTDIACLEHRT